MEHKQESRPKTRTMHIPLDIHKQVSRIALERDEDKKDIAAEVMRLGLAQIQHASPPIHSN